MTVDIALHVAGALAMQAGGALPGAALGFFVGKLVGQPALGAAIGAAIGAIPAGYFSARFWKRREERQALKKASGRINHAEWRWPMFANIAGVPGFAAVAAVVATIMGT